MQASAIYQRTESGRNEIKNKMHGLTQSERLALIVIDGVSTYGELRTKLKGLSEERFDRALTKLLNKSFVFEVLLADDQNVIEELDTKTIDHFLHQDLLDPVTIISYDPEEEFGLDVSPGSAPEKESIKSPGNGSNAGASLMQNGQSASMPRSSVTDAALSSTARAAVQASVAAKRALKIASVDFYVPLEPINSAIVAPAKIIVKSQIKPNRIQAPQASFDAAALEASVLFATTPARKFRWGQVLVLFGLILIALSLAITFLR